MTSPVPESGIFPVPATWGELWKPVAGVHIGRCVDGSEFPKVQGAHYHPLTEAFPSWICVRYPHMIYHIDEDVNRTDRPGAAMLHELAHVLTARGHNDDVQTDRYIWADTMLELLKMERISPIRASDSQLMAVCRQRTAAIRRMTYGRY